MTTPEIPPPTADDLSLKPEFLIELHNRLQLQAAGEDDDSYTIYAGIIRRLRSAEVLLHAAETRLKEIQEERQDEYDNWVKVTAELTALKDVEAERDGLKATLELLNAAGTYIVRCPPKVPLTDTEEP